MNYEKDPVVWEIVCHRRVGGTRYKVDLAIADPPAILFSSPEDAERVAESLRKREKNPDVAWSIEEKRASELTGRALEEARDAYLAPQPLQAGHAYLVDAMFGAAPIDLGEVDNEWDVRKALFDLPAETKIHGRSVYIYDEDGEADATDAEAIYPCRCDLCRHQDSGGLFVVTESGSVDHLFDIEEDGTVVGKYFPICGSAFRAEWTRMKMGPDSEIVKVADRKAVEEISPKLAQLGKVLGYL